MTDATHEFGTADYEFHEIHLSGKQLVFLFMATTVVSVIIFLLGVWVGRGVPVQRQSAEQLVDAAAVPVPAAAPVMADAGPPAAEPPAPPAEAEELSYKKRLESDAAATESLKPRAPERASKPAPPPATSNAASPAQQQTVAGTPRAGVWVVQVHSLRNRGVASGIVERLVTKGYPAFLVAAGPPTGSYKVQVGRFKNRDEAQRVVERLKKEEQFNPWITR